MTSQIGALQGQVAKSEIITQELAKDNEQLQYKIHKGDEGIDYSKQSQDIMTQSG